MQQGFLYLEDGEILSGTLFGHMGETQGEVVFSTGMTGYPQSLTDPSFAGQILTFTYPLIGNYGVPEMVYQDTHLAQNFESEHIWAAGVVLSSFAQEPSHYQSAKTFSHWLAEHKIVGISDIDTRALTQKIREHGVLKGVISAEKKRIDWGRVSIPIQQKAVSCAEIIEYVPKEKNGKHIALIDCGVKHGIVRALLLNGYTISRVPWDFNPLELKTKIDGVVCSNGPWDPKDWAKTITNIQSVLKAKLPFVGVCLGHQLLSLAVGADTYKLKYGHRGLNQPCQDTDSKKCYLTSQNHGFAVKNETIPSGFKEWFVNLNDGTNEGIKNEQQKIWSTQFHPEGEPGPFDTKWVFELI